MKLSKWKVSLIAVLCLTLVAAVYVPGNNSKIYAAETVNARDFGVRAGVVSDQSAALHAAMKHFYDRGVQGTVYLPAGTYYVDNAVRLHAGVSLIGDGMGKTIIKKTGTVGSYVFGNPILRGNSDLNATVSYLTIDADRTNRAARGLGQVGGINMDADIRRLTLSNVEIRDTTIGALLRRTKDSIITNSVFDRTSGHAIAAGHESYPVGEFRNVQITKNRITNSSGGSGINLSRAAHSVVTDNEIINSVQQSDTYGGIRIPNGGEYNTVKNNRIVNYPRGIFLTTGARYNTIENNTIVDSRIHGILVESNNNYFRGNTIQQVNTALNPETIRLSNASSNEVSGNRMSTYSSFRNFGIRVTGNSNNNQILNNVTSTSGTSVSIEGGSGNTVRGNTNTR
ncbi:glycosyl hydrolase family 28-related protein [Paenibacillus tarimensis]|uniref:glycosyl hydrolase family 28-related protein n=1 Tax=Paenibacillus tarimensis TaxID=416012 RepID=UPI001F1BF42B|nr:glycosyl hydrolase family 28-related protein [Paenibacillus tarimensis]MCF2942805.1 right-handed parallel beta-helix repeat-containing protein [Paenibacillus tarimensis]